MEKHEYFILIDRLLTGNASPKEANRLFNWFKRAEAREELFKEYAERWKMSSDILAKDIQCRMFEKINSVISVEETIKKTTKSSDKGSSVEFKKRDKVKWLSFGVAASLALLLTFNFISWISTTSERKQEFIVSADLGQKASIVLPDGTTVWLNSKTNLYYTPDYNVKERVLYLDGEAFFEVAKDKKRPFIVKADGLDVMAVGTSFNVKSYSSEKEISVTLLEGKVNVGNGIWTESLVPNENITYHNEKHSYTKTVIPNASHAALWRQGQLAFYNESLEDIAKALTRMYNVQIDFKSEYLKYQKFSGVIKNTSLNNVLEILGVSAPLKYSIKDNLITIDAI